MKNALTITFKDITRQLAKFGLAERLEDVASSREERKIFEKEFSTNEKSLDEELKLRSELPL